jgi:hypothetical protein
MTDPIVVEFEVNASAEHAFAMWTSRGSQTAQSGAYLP